ncbi:hypothetical protein EXN13_15585 [Clostridium botulinum]|nr:hypothetical protein [Clostridium botulinum]
MREICLIDDIEYKRIYKEEKRNDGTILCDGSYTSWMTTLKKKVYTSEDLTENNENINVLVNKTIERYNSLFEERNMKATPQQLNFASETAKILLSNLKNKEIIPVIPAPCGFGKSTITQVFLNVVCEAYKEGTLIDGMIIVTDRIEQLYELHENIIDSQGYYKIEKKDNKIFKTPFTYILEGWKEDSFERKVCLNKDFKSYENGMCSSESCPFYGECKISKQKYQQIYSPIILLTNARLETFSESINIYSTYKDIEDNLQSRTLRINDEKPSMRDAFRVDTKILNNIENEIYTIDNNEDRRKLIDKFMYISNIIKQKFRDYEKYDRMIVSNINNTPILLSDKEFMELWHKYFKKKFSYELRHIHTVLTKGGLFVNAGKRGMFISTIGMKKILNEKMKTVIFDGTALVDNDYNNEDIIKFVDIDNPRTFDNVDFNFYLAHKLNKSKFNSKKYLINACANFLKTIKKEQTYVVTYSERAKTIMREIKKNEDIMVNHNKAIGITNIVGKDEDTLFYFGNTKGSNKAQNCTQMVQFGWNNLPDYEYLIRYLCTNFTEERWEHILKEWDLEKAELFMKVMCTIDLKEGCGDNFWIYKNYSMLTDFIQEVFRTKMRNYNSRKNITIHCFACSDLLRMMIKEMFSKCNMNIEHKELECFQEAKILGRDEEKETIAQKILNFIHNGWDGNEIKSNNMLKKIGITKKQFDKAKENNKDLKKIINKYMIKRGVYKKVS